MANSFYRGRFAPSPTGQLHAGSLFTAFTSWLLARHAKGQWLIRIEDVDRDRCLPGAAEHQLATLTAFGMSSDLPVVWQSQRNHLYQSAVERLLADDHAFICGCSRTQLATTGGRHHYCLAPTRPDGRNAIRLRTRNSGIVAFTDLLQGPQSQNLAMEVGDVVLHRADGCWAYQLAVVVDDDDQGITDVVRGADLLDSTARQIWLQRCLGITSPRYLHLPLLTNEQGNKLSKSDDALPVSADNSRNLLRWMWQLLNQHEGVLDQADTAPAMLELAAQHFQPKRLPSSLHSPSTMHTSPATRLHGI